MNSDDRVNPSSNPAEQYPRIARRGLLVFGVACGVAACRADADIGPLPMDPIDPGNGDDADTSGGDDVDTSGGDDVQSMGGDDVPVTPPTDDGVVTMRDAGGGPQPDVVTPQPDVVMAPDVQPMCTPTGRSVGTLATFASGTWHLISSPQVIVAHDAGGLYAYSSICTHSGCVVNRPSSSGQALCACHGSVFDGNGAVVNGPARSPLQHYGVNVCMGTVYVDTSSRVSATTRTPASG